MSNLTGKCKVYGAAEHFDLSAATNVHEDVPDFYYTLGAYQTASVEYHLNISASVGTGYGLRARINASPNTVLLHGGLYGKDTSDTAWTNATIPVAAGNEILKTFHNATGEFNHFIKYGIHNTSSAPVTVQLSIARKASTAYRIQSGSYMVEIEANS